MVFYQGVGALTFVVLAFVATEGQGTWHRPAFEYVFWVLVLWIVSTLALLAPDSPIQYFVTVNKHPASLAVIFGLAVPLYAALVVHNFVESGMVSFQQHRNKDFQDRLKQAQSNSRNHANNSLETLRDEARRSRRTSSMFDASVANEKDFVSRSKQQYVNRTLDRLVFSSQIRHFAAWMRGQIDERQEALRKVIQESDKDELNQIINSVNVPKLLRHGNNGRKVDNILKYLMEERHNDLSTIARASILHGLMRSQTLPFFSKEMEWAVTVFCGSKDGETTLLKNMLDSSGDFNNLYKLVYNDIKIPDLRKKLLKHISKQGKIVIADNKERGHQPLKILSDVDDTVFCSGGSFPAGVDSRFPRHATYPGALTLFEEIDLTARAGSNGRGEPEAEDSTSNPAVNVEVHIPWKQGGGIVDIECHSKESVQKIQGKVQAQFNVPPSNQKLVVTAKKQGFTMEDNVDLWKDGNMVFVSARPHVFKDIAENGSYRRFHKLIGEGKMHSTPTMLSGSLTSGTLAVVFRIVENMQMFVQDLVEVVQAFASSLSEKAMKKAKKRAKKMREKSLPLEEDVEDDDDEGGLNGIDGINGTELRRQESSLGGRAATNRNWELVGKTKVENIENYSVLYPEYQLVFFGDNGQGDLLCAELVSSSGTCKDQVKMCMIHKVQSNEDESLLSAFEPSEREEKWEENNIFFFETYMEAAAISFESGLITAHGLHRVGLAVHDESIEFFIKYPHRDWNLILKQTKRDIRRANKLLRITNPNLQIPVPILPQMNLSK